MKNYKRYMTAVAAGICIAAVGVGIGTTMAYMTEKDEVTNVFTVGDLDVGLKEPEWDPDDGDGINMYPGYTVYKNPTVKNITSDRNGEEPCYARMLIHIQDEDGNLIEDPEAIELVKETIRFDSSYTGNYEEKGAGSVLTQGRVPGYALEELKDIPMVNPDFTLDKARSEPNVLVYNYMGKDGAGILKIGEEAAFPPRQTLSLRWMKKLETERFRALKTAKRTGPMKTKKIKMTKPVKRTGETQMRKRTRMMKRVR